MIQADSSAHIDPAVFRMYRLATSNADTMRALYLDFFAALPQALDQIDSQMQTGAWPAVASLAHTWKGNSGTLGLRSLEVAFTAMEASAMRPDAPLTRAAIAQVHAMHAAAKAAVADALTSIEPCPDGR